MLVPELPIGLDLLPSRQKPQRILPFKIPLLKIQKLPLWVESTSFQPLQKRQLLNNEKKEQLNTLSSLLTYKNFEQKYSQLNNNRIPLYEQIYKSSLPNTIDLTDLNQHSNSSKLQTHMENLSKSQQIQNNPYYFRSDFESGNLDMVYKTNSKLQYHLLIRNDINTNGYNLWYFFQIRKNPAIINNQNLIIKIVNFNKSQILYQRNLRPWVLTNLQTQWKTIMEIPKFQKTNIINPQTNQNYYQLTFILKPGFQEAYISLLPPYTYSRLGRLIESISDKNIKIDYVDSLCNNPIPIINLIVGNIEKIHENIIIMGRIHPGEVWSSYLIEQIIHNLLKQQPKLRKQVNRRYIIIPMLNPDGVIYGNFRCDLSGNDLNRVWNNPKKSLYPSIYSIKKYLSKVLTQSNSINICLDFHSHSKNYGIFAYNCHNNSTYNQTKHLCERLEKQISPIFIQHQCTYIDSQSILKTNKKSTARACLADYCDISMTIEISFDGYIDKKKYIKKFTKQDFIKISQTIIHCLDWKLISEDYGRLPTGIRQRNQESEQKKQLSSDSDPQKYYTRNKVDNRTNVIKYPKTKLKSTRMTKQLTRNVLNPFSNDLTQSPKKQVQKSHLKKTKHTYLYPYYNIFNQKKSASLQVIKGTTESLKQKSPNVYVVTLRQSQSIQKNISIKNSQKIFPIRPINRMKKKLQQISLQSKNKKNILSNLLKQKLQGEKIISLYEKEKYFYANNHSQSIDKQIRHKNKIKYDITKICQKAINNLKEKKKKIIYNNLSTQNIGDNFRGIENL